MNKKGFSLVELMIVVALLVVIMASTFQSMSVGKKAWEASDGKMQLKASLRQAVTRISQELRQSSDDQVTVLDDYGSSHSGFLNNTDAIQFSIPVIFNSGDPYIALDIYGDTVVSNWGAPLNWGCADVSCMDIDYTHIFYGVNNQGQLIRRVINDGDGTVHSESIMTSDISEFIINDLGSMLRLQITSLVVTGDNRTIDETRWVNVYLRN